VVPEAHRYAVAPEAGFRTHTGNHREIAITQSPTAAAAEVLAKLGLTEYEAKAYLALLTESPLSGYSIARNSGVPRSKIYEVLGSLVGKGAVLASHGDPVRYAPLSPKELLTRYRDEMEQVLDRAEGALGRYAAQQQAGALIWDVQGRSEIIARARELIDRATRTVLMEIWAADADELRPVLRAAAERGVTVTVVAYGDLDYPFATIYQHDSTDEITGGLGGRWLVLSVDMREIIAGTVSLGSDSRAAWSTHVGLVIPITELIKHDLYKLEMLGAHRDVLEDTFGPGLARLRDRFPPFPGLRG
jgi:HTH-type transcriptional regulator, sugar sensing transcriptional regulator